MNTTAMAERTAKAVDAIRADVERLGGQLEMPMARFPNPAVKHTLTLEAIAAALAGIGASPEGAAVEPAEAVVAVAAEPDTPKGKRGKGA